MAPRDPLLASLRVCVLNMQSDGGMVTDSSPHLPSCCELLELVLRKGLQQPVLSLVQRDYWHCFEQLPHHDTCSRLSALSLAVEQTRACRKLISAQGRGRYLLRLALSRRTLSQFFTHLLHTSRVLEWYSPTLSILRNEEFVEPFMSLLLVLSHMEFKLDMENCSFLDESWLLPVCDTYEVVPCREVGMILRYLSGRVFVLDLVPGSQAHVDMFVSAGDIIDEINGTSLRNSKNGQAGVVLSRLKGRPLSIRILRCRAQDGTVYRPLVKLLRDLRTENPNMQLSLNPLQKETDDNRRPPGVSQCLKEGRIVYIVKFLGKANIGMFGGKEVLQHAIPQVLRQNLSSKDVLLDLKETHVTCTDRNSTQKLFEHHYPEISCVGRFAQPGYTIFAFCVADSPETPQSSGFCCVVLKASTIKDCEDIVCRIGEAC
uniref:Si:ch211-250n8.1 n=1 Tax=Cyprinodon variegatus TaxID=28743 RepID=A0A3Q2FRD1_CYPVA